MAASLNKLPPGFILDAPDSAGLPPGFKLDTPASAPEESFGQRMLGSAASTADIIAESVPGMAAMVAYPFRRAAGIVTGETAEDIAASQERVMGAVSAPVGRALGVTETPSYQQNMLRQALGYVAENIDKGADWISGTTGIPKPDVVNMMQIVMSAAPAKVPGAKTAGKLKARVVETARNVMDPKTKFYMDLAEGRGSALLAAARAPEAEIIPGVRPTFAQATADVGLPRVAAAGEQAAAMRPTEAMALRDVQEAARVGQLRAIERTPERRELAETVRERRAEPLYRAAETAGDVVDVTPTLSFIDDTIAKNPGNQPLLTEMRRIRKGLVKPGMDEEGNPVLVPRTDAKEVASTIDGLKSAIAKEDNRFIKGELTQIKDELTAAIPSLPEAQAAFKKGSRPINQMDVGRYLREKLETPLPEGAQRPGVFAGAVREAPRTIRQALDGGPTYEKLTDILSPAQKANVDRVVMDLARDQRVKELAQAGRKAAPELAKPVGAANLPSLLNRLATVANEVIRRLEGRINEKLAMEIALEFLDADRAAAALETAMRRSAKRAPAPRRPSGPISRAVKRAPVVTAPNQMNQDNRNAMAR
jgi:hypothetical protein